MESPQKINRRALLKMGMSATAGTVATGLGISSIHAEPSEVTPEQVVGPFYPIHEQDDKDVDLTLIKGHTQRAKGSVIHVRGQVMDEDSHPIPDAMVEIWQANAAGRYTHEKDDSEAPLDPNFQSWGQTVTDAQGGYGFKTILPGAYGNRTRHIHFRIARRGYHELVTQCYFPGEPLNEKDNLFKSLSPAERVIATVVPADSGKKNHFQFNISLRKVLTSGVDEKTLESYVGKYQVKSDENTMNFAVTRDGNQLYVEMDGFFPKFEIRPLGDGRFSFSARRTGQEISFNANGKGKVNGVTLRRKGNPDLKGKKLD